MLHLRGITFLILLFVFFPSFVFSAEEIVFGYPTSDSGENVSPISLNLGGSWYSTVNKKWLRGHTGIDLVENALTPIFAASSGTIDKVLRWPKCKENAEVCVNGVCKIEVVSNRGWGPTVIIKHENQNKYITEGAILEASTAEENPTVVYTQYGHLDTVEHLKEGQPVVRGEELGVIGAVCGWIPHLHFEIKDTEAIAIDRRTSAGAGFGYSGVDNHAPHRYIPQVFIEKNRLITVPDPQPEVVSIQPTVQTEQKQASSFLKRTWNSLSTFLIQSLKRMIVAVPTPEQQEKVVNINSNILGTQTENGETSVERVYGARFVQREVPVSFVKGAKQMWVSVEIENTGTAVWEKNTVSLNVVGGRTSNAMWYHPTWVTQLRPVIISQRVEGGQKATVSFTLTIPEIDRQLRLQLVRPEGGAYVQLGTMFTTIVLSEVVVPLTSPVLLTSTPSIVLPISQPSDEDASSATQTESTAVLTPFIDTPSVFIRSGGGGGRNRDTEDDDVLIEEEEDTIPTTTPTSTDPTPTSTPTNTEPVVTSTDSPPELSDISITTPVDPAEVVYTNESQYVFAGTSDEYTETVVVTKDDVAVATTTPSGGVWEVPIVLTTGTQSFVLYGTASEGRQTSSTTIIVVYDIEAPFIDVQLLSVGEGSIVVDLFTFDDSPVSGYVVEFFEVVEYVGEEIVCEDGLLSFEAPQLQYFMEGDDLFVEIIGTGYGCGFIVDTQVVAERVVSASYDQSYVISVRAKGTDAAGNQSDWWYSAIPLAFPDIGDVEIQL